MGAHISKGRYGDVRSDKWYRGGGGAINRAAIARADKDHKAFEENVEINCKERLEKWYEKEF